MEELDSNSEFPSNQLSGRVVGRCKVKLTPLKFTSVNVKTNDSADDTSDSQADMDTVPAGRVSPAADIESDDEPMSPVIPSQSSNLGMPADYLSGQLADEVISSKPANSERRKSPRKLTDLGISIDDKTFHSPGTGKSKRTSPLSKGRIRNLDGTADALLSPRLIKAEKTQTASQSQNHASASKQLKINEFLSPTRKTVTTKRKADTGSGDQDGRLQRKSDTEPSDMESDDDKMEPDKGGIATEFDCCKTVKYVPNKSCINYIYGNRTTPTVM